jgi:dihydroorotate dehydrogenase
LTAPTADCTLPRYDPAQTYAWNYEHAPEPTSVDVLAVLGLWEFCGLPVNSPLGIAAGPLLNGRWVLYYASLGFDVLTYKTVRSRAWPCYELPNLQAVDATEFRGGEEALPSSPTLRDSWAVSFGMPSKSPDLWRADVEATRAALPKGKLLSVSVVGSPEPDWTVEQLADDYAACARWAAEAGADCVEANFSCPNVQSCDGQLYQRSRDAAVVAAALRAALGRRVPLLIKVGHITDRHLAEELLTSLAAHVDALVMVNCVSARVLGPDGRPMFAGQRRGIAGPAIRAAALAQVRLFDDLIRGRGLSLKLVGVGGIGSAADVREFLDAGCHSVQLATAAMLAPSVGVSIRRDLAPGTAGPGAA